MSWCDLRDSLLGNTRAPEEGDSRLLDSSSESEGEVVTMSETIDNTQGEGERGALFNSINLTTWSGHQECHKAGDPLHGNYESAQEAQVLVKEIEPTLERTKAVSKGLA